MRLDQAEAFVRAVAEATGRLPVVYVHPTWANGDPLPNSGLSLGARITPDSILARCGLWVADYHDLPEIPLAWAASGWRLWQYAGDESAGRPAYGQTSIVQGVSHCDRNLFNGDATRSIGSGARPAALEFKARIGLDGGRPVRGIDELGRGNADATEQDQADVARRAVRHAGLALGVPRVHRGGHGASGLRCPVRRHAARD